MNNPVRTALSRSSVILSSVCLLHCLATPVLILALPSFSVLVSDTLEWVLILAVVPLSVGAFLPTWLRHRNPGLMASFAIGLGFVILSQFLFHQHLHSEESYRLPGTLCMAFGAGMVAWTIFRNNRHTHVCDVPGHVH